MTIKKPILKFDDKDLDLNFECDITSDNIGLGSLNQQINDMKRDIEACDNEINRLTNHAKLVDYSLAVASGALASFLDTILTKNLDLGSPTGLVNQFASELTGESFTSTNEALGSLNQSLNNSASINNLDLASHASFFGLVFSIVSALTGTKILYTKHEEIKTEKIKPIVEANLYSGIFYGTVMWLSNLIFSKAKPAANLPLGLKSLIDDASSSGLKTNGDAFYEAVANNLDTGSLNAISTGLNTLKMLGSQALIVSINEIVVRAVYFVHELIKEIKQKNVRSLKQLVKVDFKKTIPFNNRTVSRMISVSLITMMTVDICDASIESSIKSEGNKALFASNLLIRINFVGVGRLILSLTTDTFMGKTRKRKRAERISLVENYTSLLGRKLYCLQDDVWKECHKASEVIESVRRTMADAAIMAKSDIDLTKESLESISIKADSAFEKNESLKKDVKDILNWE